MTGMFIAFEGGDGAGKSTQIALLAEHLANTGRRDVVVTREPGGTGLGAAIRQALLHGEDPICTRAQALLFAADRAQHVEEVIRPALERGAIVLTDRYIDSSLAYQGAGNGDGMGHIAMLSDYASGGLTPDLTLLLDVDPLVSLARSRVLGAPDNIESLGSGFQTRLRAAFLELAQCSVRRFAVIDAAQTIDDVASEVAAAVDDAVRAAERLTPAGPAAPAHWHPSVA